MGRIEDVKEISPPIELRPFGDGELALERKIQLYEAKSAKRVARKISLAEFGRHRKGCGIDSSPPGQGGILARIRAVVFGRRRGALSGQLCSNTVAPYFVCNCVRTQLHTIDAFVSAATGAVARVSR